MKKQNKNVGLTHFLSLVFLLAALILATACGNFLTTSEDTNSNNSGNNNYPSSQVWLVTFHDSGSAPHPQTVKVIVPAFTYSGTWGEVSDSPGLYMYGPDGVCKYRLMVGGNVVNDGSGDRFSSNLSGIGCGMQTMGSCEFTANGHYPNATGATGSFTLTTQSPLGTVNASNTITAVRQ